MATKQKTGKRVRITAVPSEDHDLLIELRTRFMSMSSDIKEIKDNQSVAIEHLNNRVSAVESTIVSQDKTNSNFRASIISWGSAGLLVLGGLEVLFNTLGQNIHF